jgi:hypothetical protein
MVLDRRWVIRSAGVSFTLSPIAHAQSLSDAPAGPDYTDLIKEVLGMFRPMPGVKSLLIWAPKTADQPELKISLDPALRMFVGSAFKAFVLCERLRQLDGRPWCMDRLWAPEDSLAISAAYAQRNEA